MADSTSETFGTGEGAAGCRKFSRSDLIQINAEVAATVWTPQMPINTGLSRVRAAVDKPAIRALMFCSDAEKLGATSVYR